MAARRAGLPAIVPRQGSAEIFDRLTQLEAERAACERLLDLAAQERPRIVAAGTLDDLERHDREADRNRLRIEQCDARYAELQEQHAAAVELEEQKRRQALYDQGVEARKRAVQRLVQYQDAAAEIASILRAYRHELDVIGEANAALPVGAEPISPAEPFNGRLGRPAGYRPFTEVATFFAGTNIRAPLGGRSPAPTEVRRVESQVPEPAVPGVAHRALLDDVVLPGIGSDAPSYWRGSTILQAETAAADATLIAQMRFAR